MDIYSNLDQILALEQEFIDTYKPKLKVDLIAASSKKKDYHEPMSHFFFFFKRS